MHMGKTFFFKVAVWGFLLSRYTSVQILLSQQQKKQKNKNVMAACRFLFFSHKMWLRSKHLYVRPSKKLTSKRTRKKKKKTQDEEMQLPALAFLPCHISVDFGFLCEAVAGCIFIFSGANWCKNDKMWCRLEKRLAKSNSCRFWVLLCSPSTKMWPARSQKYKITWCLLFFPTATRLLRETNSAQSIKLWRKVNNKHTNTDITESSRLCRRLLARGGGAVQYG